MTGATSGAGTALTFSDFTTVFKVRFNKILKEQSRETGNIENTRY
jgi:hypothetical protein